MDSKGWSNCLSSLIVSSHNLEHLGCRDKLCKWFSKLRILITIFLSLAGFFSQFKKNWAQSFRNDQVYFSMPIIKGVKFLKFDTLQNLLNEIWDHCLLSCWPTHLMRKQFSHTPVCSSPLPFVASKQNLDLLQFSSIQIEMPWSFVKTCHDYTWNTNCDTPIRSALLPFNYWLIQH